jgi:CheY-like chemotaxis protein
LNVLVVEDNEINRLVVREMLQTIGHHVTEAHDGIDGVEQAEQTRYDLILMDISMPRMDGVEATRRIRAGDGACAKIPIIALTANAMLHEISSFRAAGMNETLTKPISRKSLGRALDIARSANAESDPRPIMQAEIPEVPAIDRDQLLILAEEIGAQQAMSLLDRFLSQTETDLGDLFGRDLLSGDPLAVQRKVHKLAGSAGMLGASLLQHRLTEFDSLAKTGRANEIIPRLGELSPIWEKTKIGFDEIRNSNLLT